mgnify:CR=1 FL=1
MGRKVWRRPLTRVQQFEANEYVAACGDSGVTYNFVCDAGEPYRYWQPGIFGGGHWVTDDHPYRVVANNGESWSSYGPCEATHVAESSDEFLNGYIDNMYTQENENIPVVIWKEHRGGWLGDNIHCTTKLNMNEWETAKS